MRKYRIAPLAWIVIGLVCSGSLAFGGSKKKTVKVFLGEKGQTPHGMWINGYGGGYAAKMRDKKDRLFVEAVLKSFKERMVWNFDQHRAVEASEFKDPEKLAFAVTIKPKEAYSGKLSLGWMNGADVTTQTELRVNLKAGKTVTLTFALPDPGEEKLTGFSIGCSDPVSFALTQAEVIKSKKRR